MKFYTFALLAVIALYGCGDDHTPLNNSETDNTDNTGDNTSDDDDTDNDTSDDEDTVTLPNGAKLILDAANVAGANAGPGTAACNPTVWTDLSGEGNNGTLVNCDGAEDGWAGTGTTADPYRLEFDGTNTAVQTLLKPNSTNMPNTTWMAWVQSADATPTDEYQIMSIDMTGGAFDRSVLFHLNSSDFGIFDGTGQINPTGFAANTWYHVAVVFTPDDIIFYKNGTPFAKGSAPAADEGNQNLSIGSANNGTTQHLHGAIAWVALYDRALTQQEITDSCNYLKERFAGVTCN